MAGGGLWYSDPHKRNAVCTTLCEMLEDRGYQLVVDDNHLTGSEQRHLREMPIVGVNDDGDLIAVEYCAEAKMSVKSLRRLVATLGSCARLACVVSVVHESVTPFAVKEQQGERRLHIFKYEELMRNVTHHVQVPRHRRVDPDQVDAVLGRTYTKLDKMPEMSEDDMVVRYFGWPPGTVVEILRHMLGLTQRYYRIVRAAT